MNRLMNELLNDEAVYRTAPATPGLLIIYNLYNLQLIPLIGLFVWNAPTWC